MADSDMTKPGNIVVPEKIEVTNGLKAQAKEAVDALLKADFSQDPLLQQLISHPTSNMVDQNKFFTEIEGDKLIVYLPAVDKVPEKPAQDDEIPIWANFNTQSPPPVGSRVFAKVFQDKLKKYAIKADIFPISIKPDEPKETKESEESKESEKKYESATPTGTRAGQNIAMLVIPLNIEYKMGSKFDALQKGLALHDTAVKKVKEMVEELEIPFDAKHMGVNPATGKHILDALHHFLYQEARGRLMESHIHTVAGIATYEAHDPHKQPELVLSANEKEQVEDLKKKFGELFNKKILDESKEEAWEEIPYIISTLHNFLYAKEKEWSRAKPQINGANVDSHTSRFLLNELEDDFKGHDADGYSL